MPVKIGIAIPVPEQPIADINPDVRTDVPLSFVPTFAMETPLVWPPSVNGTDGPYVPDFTGFTKEQRLDFEMKYRYQAIRMRHDIADRTIPLTKETLDIP